MNLLRRAIISAVGGSFNLAENFATTLYTGNGATQSIISDLDYTTKDGLVWMKNRTDVVGHILMDTIRGTGVSLASDSAVGDAAAGGVQLTAFNANGFDVGAGASVNGSGDNQVAWQFMKEQGFFDIVEYVGDGISGRAVAHSLDAAVGLVLTKRVSASENWLVQHKDLVSSGNMNYANLNLSNGFLSDPSKIRWGGVSDANNIYMGSDFAGNGSGEDYISYLFAHNPYKGIYCGSYTGTGAAGNKQTTGFPVGWLLIKKTNASADWALIDITRDGDSLLNPNQTAAEQDLTVNGITFLSDGFEFEAGTGILNSNTDDFIYVAIADPNQF